MTTVRLKDSSVLTIREATPYDAEGIIEYLSIVGGESDNLLFGSEGLPISPEEEKQLLASYMEAPASAMVLGTIDGEIACLGSVSSPLRERIAHNGEIALSVRKKYWNIGVGSAIMDALMDFAKSNGTTKVLQLGVRAENTHAIHLYENKGFVKVGSHKNYFYLDGNFSDLILMDLYL